MVTYRAGPNKMRLFQALFPSLGGKKLLWFMMFFYDFSCLFLSVVVKSCHLINELLNELGAHFQCSHYLHALIFNYLTVVVVIYISIITAVWRHYEGRKNDPALIPLKT